MLRVMTPLLGTKNSSAPVGDKSSGDRRAARSLLSCALWRGMGGMGDPSRCFSVHDCSPLFTIVRHCSAKNITPEPVSPLHPHRQHSLFGFYASGNTNHETRLFFAVGAQGTHNQKPPPGLPRTPPGRCFPVRHGAAMARHGRPTSATPATRPVGFSPATRHETRISSSLRRLQGEQPQARPTGFHESRNKAFILPYPPFPTISRHFPAPPTPPPTDQGSARRPPFWTGLTKSAVRWKSHKNAQNPGSHRKMREAQRSPRSRCRERRMNPC